MLSKKEVDKMKPFRFLTILFAGVGLLTGCGNHSEYTTNNSPFFCFSMDQVFRFGDVDYSGYGGEIDIRKRDELIGFIIREEDAETFEREEDYIYGVVADFYVYDYDKKYLPVYSIVDTDYHDRIIVQASYMLLQYVNTSLIEEESVR